MKDLRVESAAHGLVSRALPNGLAVYRSLFERLPCDHPLDDGEAAAVGGAVLLYGLYCRLLELEAGPEPGEAMERAFDRLRSEPEHSPALIASVRKRYEGMLHYKVFRSGVTILEFISERAWHVAYPGQETDQDSASAFQGFVQFLAEESYGKLQEWNLVCEGCRSRPKACLAWSMLAGTPIQRR
jgi:hypothetical protein